MKKLCLWLFLGNQEDQSQEVSSEQIEVPKTEENETEAEGLEVQKELTNETVEEQPSSPVIEPLKTESEDFENNEVKNEEVSEEYIQTDFQREDEITHPEYENQDVETVHEFTEQEYKQESEYQQSEETQEAQSEEREVHIEQRQDDDMVVDSPEVGESESKQEIDFQQVADENVDNEEQVVQPEMIPTYTSDDSKDEETSNADQGQKVGWCVCMVNIMRNSCEWIKFSLCQRSSLTHLSILQKKIRID